MLRYLTSLYANSVESWALERSIILCWTTLWLTKSCLFWKACTQHSAHMPISWNISFVYIPMLAGRKYCKQSYDYINHWKFTISFTLPMKWVYFIHSSFFQANYQGLFTFTCPITQHFIFEADLIPFVAKFNVPQRLEHAAEVKCCTSAMVVNAEPSNAHVSTRKFV